VADASDKSTLRAALLARRRSLPPDVVAAAGPALLQALLPVLPPGGPVAVYAALGTEPPTAPLLERLGDRALLPVLDDDGDLDWAAWDGALRPGPRGTAAPGGARLGRDAVGGCGLVVVPALAVDRRGVRLGRGGGSYDRALPRATGLVVALLHDGELVEELPAEPHDVPVGAVATPSGGLQRSGILGP
jgi:5-formyltetrahydrofolate cyclo-ligase